jgi:hypothetical protein
MEIFHAARDLISVQRHVIFIEFELITFVVLRQILLQISVLRKFCHYIQII